MCHVHAFTFESHYCNAFIYRRESAVSPSPFFCTTFRGRISTSLLRSLRSSGLMTGAESSLALPLSTDGAGSPSPCDAEELCRWVRGLGKLRFLSTASTLRWKRRNKASARISVESRSIVLESSLTKFGQVSTCSSRYVTCAMTYRI